MADGHGASLAELGLTAPGAGGLRLSGLTADSRQVRPGMLFAALPGAGGHGARFMDAALAAGAAAVLTDARGQGIAGDLLAASEVPVALSQDARAAFARAAALWFGAQPATMVAVTGTNGKTSVATFARMIWEALGHPAINLGTTGVEGAMSAALGHTTPDPLTLHRLLSEAARQGVTHAAMEASSHGLDQRRLDGVWLAAAGFTNLTQDHLDYHASMDSYFDAKMGLFGRLLPEDGVAVVNLDDPHGAEVVARAAARGIEVIGTGRDPGARLRLVGQRFDPQGQEMLFAWQGKGHQVHLPLVGGFQAANVLVAAGLVIGAGEDADEVIAALPSLRGVRGRMQLAARRANGAAVYVDYAHTPDAVATAITALRPHVLGRIVAIIGAGGDRDRGKRPLMGGAAAMAADAVIVTDDNPRSEDPAAIRAAVIAGVRAGGGDPLEVGDRAAAILHGVDMLGPGDALVICGKGHETGQIVGATVYPFDDAEQASIAVAALEARA
ncbi:MAG: UDP-N-acetylmuramoyl-L-alanyl-D-glutamate--2,6-diaminopimelate ligase [Rubellimicrobium sp.]|nr:UDP-N-acetylmuramoyl-L-alanyl-D-glutamate--2,6-diaminopimelate ligase [Rubellimicrobium sp.]